MLDDVGLITAADPRYPPTLLQRLGPDAAPGIHCRGNSALLGVPKTALFCSARCPGSAILPAYDQAVRWRDAGRCVVGGFHSPVEKECLRILLRGTQPVIVCPARSLPQRVPPEWRLDLATGRLLVVSAFQEGEDRVTVELAARRNQFVADLADALWFAHISPGGQLDQLAQRAHRARVPVTPASAMKDQA